MNLKSKASSRRKRDLNEGREDVERLCIHLADRVEANGSPRPDFGKKWRDAARLMLDNEKRGEAHLHAVIDWCQGHEFWRSNILSMPKLREKYDQLRLQAERNRAGANGSAPRPSTTDQRVADILALKSQPGTADPLPPNTIPGSVVQ